MLWKERAKTTNPCLRAALTCADVFWCSFSKSSILLHISFIFIHYLYDCLHSFPQQFHSSLASLFLQHFGVGEENDAELPQGQKWRRIHKSLSSQQEGEIWIYIILFSSLGQIFSFQHFLRLNPFKPLSDFWQPVAEAVSQEDSSAKIEKERESDILRILFLLFHQQWLRWVNTREIISRQKNGLNLVILNLKLPHFFASSKGRNPVKRLSDTIRNVARTFSPTKYMMFSL